jgi:hypothetical protein
VAVWLSAYRAPALAGDAQDYDGHAQADERIEDWGAGGDGYGARDDGERDVCIDAGMVAVCDQRRTVQSMPGTGADQAGEPVAGEADRAGEGEGEQVSWRG